MKEEIKDTKEMMKDKMKDKMETASSTIIKNDN
jgi:hypothetical protein